MIVTLHDVRFHYSAPPYCSCGRNRPRWRVVGPSGVTYYACAGCLADVAERVS